MQSIIPTQHQSLKEVGKFLHGGPKVAQCRVSEPKQWGEDTSAVEGTVAAQPEVPEPKQREEDIYQ